MVGPSLQEEEPQVQRRGVVRKMGSGPVQLEDPDLCTWASKTGDSKWPDRGEGVLRPELGEHIGTSPWTLAIPKEQGVRPVTSAPSCPWK